MPFSAREWSARCAVAVLTAAAIVVLLLAAWYGRTLLLLFFAGVLLAVVLRACTNWLKGWTRMPDGLALAVTVVALLASVVAVVLLVAPNVEAQVRQLAESLPNTLPQARSQLEQYGWGRRVVSQLPFAGGAVAQGMGLLKHSLATVFGALGLLGNGVVIAFLGLYLAISPGRYVRGATRLLPCGWRSTISATLYQAGDQLARWLLGKLSLMAFVGVATAVGLYFLHLPLIAPLALLAALLDFVPNIGPVTSAVPAVLLALTVGPYHAVWCALLYLGVQLLESYILEPFVQGRAVSLPPALLISSQVLLGLLLGLPGVVLATPLTVAVLVFVRRVYVGAILEQTEASQAAVARSRAA